MEPTCHIQVWNGFGVGQMNIPCRDMARRTVTNLLGVHGNLPLQLWGSLSKYRGAGSIFDKSLGVEIGVVAQKL